ncbi:hypothetical protein JQX13_14775 [Archangium violaceum]|uniref:hypothetical protein n=1 Tax=Archangium violaceum TaxID=83451 RepID=UPI00193BA6AA|nr:hypothetical protein [Archangium violaceum]QRK11221.1 hypothetical protein JQX13_14775 [Archangium violaceum]
MNPSLWTVRDGPRDLAPLVLDEEREASQAVARAFSRCGFSADEWRALHDSPLRAFLWVATADGPVRPREREACRRVLGAGRFSLSPLVGRICGEALLQLDVLGPERLGEAPDLDVLRPLCQRVADRLGLGEAARLQQFLLDVGWRVARASNGLLGVVGCVRREERQALASLEEALGPLHGGG